MKSPSYAHMKSAASGNAKWNRVFRALLITFAFVVPGCFLSHWVGSNIGNARWAWWRSLGTPPGGAVRFVHVEIRYIDSGSSSNNRTAVVYVETSRKQILNCCTQKNGGWQQANFLEDKNVRGYSNCQPYYDPASHPAFSRFRGKVVDCTRVIWNWEWIADEDFFVILEDGSVWNWHYYTGLDITLAFTCGLPLSTIGIGWGFIALRKYTRRRNAKRTGLMSSPSEDIT